MFKGIDESDGAELYSSKEEAIARARMRRDWDGDPDSKVMMQRSGVPLWFAHLVRETPLEFLAYREID